MQEPLFADKTHQPTDADLAAALGRAKRQWDALAAHVRTAFPDAHASWKHYAGQSGWQWVVRRNGRNLVYFKPLPGRFMTALALSDAAAAAAEEADLPESLRSALREAPRLPEGRGVRHDVVSAKDATIVKTLLAIKAAS